MRYHLKFVYHDTIVRVSQYTLGIDTSHDMANRVNVHIKFGLFMYTLVYEVVIFITLIEILRNKFDSN